VGAAALSAVALTLSALGLVTMPPLVAMVLPVRVSVVKEVVMVLAPMRVPVIEVVVVVLVLAWC